MLKYEFVMTFSVSGGGWKWVKKIINKFLINNNWPLFSNLAVRKALISIVKHDNILSGQYVRKKF